MRGGQRDWTVFQFRVRSGRTVRLGITGAVAAASLPHPSNALHSQREVLAEPAEAAEPLAEGLAVITLAAQRVIAAKTVVNVRSAVIQEGIEILFVDPEEVFASDALDD